MLTKQAEKGKIKFLQKAKEMFGDKFDYSLAEKEYINNYTPVTIICKEHGPFPQKPVKHVAINSLGGCPLCPKKHTSKKLTREEFIERARSVHKDKYDYSLVEYVSLKKKVKIICPIHGVFEQAPFEHLHQGHGCSLCGGSAKLNTQSFIEKAREKHGDKYDYSLVEYVNNKKKVKIICPVHGVFEQAARGHLSGRGCELCAKEDNAVAYKEYKKRLFKIFGDAYTCKEETFINTQKKATFVCKKHGEFIYKCDSILGCKVPCEQCKIENLKNNFIKKAVEKFGDRFDYSKMIYVDMDSDVNIICKKHGVFKQKPEKHLRSKNPCPLCREEERKAKGQRFIEKAKAIHNNKYDYSKTVYKGADKKVCITCPIHGDFYQVPYSHLNGYGCYECRGKNIADKLRKDTETFIKEAKIKFNNFYDYSKVEYKTNDVPVCIICPIHGEFYVTPNHHLAHHVGCSLCSDKGGFLIHETGKLYIMVDDLEAPTMMKIGVSVKEEMRRRAILNSARRAGVTIPALHVAKTWEGPTALMQRIEQMMHENYEEWNIRFPAKFDGCTEFFQYTPETAEAFDIIEETLHEIINANKAA